MRRVARLGLACLLLLASACSQESDGPSRSSEILAISPIAPRLVVQVGHAVPVEAVVWANEGNSLISLDQDGLLVTWDVATQNIVNHARLPVTWSDIGLASVIDGTRCIKLDEFSLNEAELTIAFVKDESPFGGAQEDLVETCPGLRSEGVEDRFTFTFEVETWALTQSPEWVEVNADSIARYFENPPPFPEQDPQEEILSGGAVHIQEPGFGGAQHVAEVAEDVAVSPDARFFPISPDGRLRPGPNHDDGKPGIAQDSATRGLAMDTPTATCRSVDRCRHGINLYPVGANAGPVIALTGNARSIFRDADISSDGRHLVRVEESSSEISINRVSADLETVVEVLDLANGTGRKAMRAEQPYHRAIWLTPDRYALISEGYAASPMMPDIFRLVPPAMIVDPQCYDSGGCADIESYSAMAPLDEAGAFLGIASLANCSTFWQRDNGPINQHRCYLNADVVDEELNFVDTSSALAMFPDSPFADSLSIHPAPVEGNPNAWRRIELPGLKNGELVTAFRLSSDRTMLAAATLALGEPWNDYRDDSFTMTVRVLSFQISGDGDLSRPRPLIEFSEDISNAGGELMGGFSPFSGIDELEFTLDGTRILFTRRLNYFDDSNLYVLDPLSERTARVTPGYDEETYEHFLERAADEDIGIYPFDSRRVVAAGNDLAFGLDNRRMINLSSGETLPRVLNDLPMVRSGYIEKSNMLWAVSDDGAIHFWGAEDGVELITLYTFPDNRFFVVTPGGSYDTNLSPDSNDIRWVIEDKPWESLPAQTFMRDYYQPGLFHNLLECREGRGDCAEVLNRHLPAIANLNRVLPIVEITDISASTNPAEAHVTVTVEEGASPDGSTSSGMYNLRLFRNGRLVAATPNRIEELPTGARSWQDTVLRWRRSNRLSEGGTYSFQFTVPLPTGPDSERQLFSAYAFNEDRIKSATAEREYVVEENLETVRQPRAFVINIGIDGYEASDLQLNYAVADAQLLARQLAQIRGYEVRQLSLLARRQSEGPVESRVTKQTILRALQLLNSGNNRESVLEALQEDGIDASMLEEATPDDIVILTYSGHGWTDAIGNFFLIPSNGRAGGGSAIASLLSSAELSYALRTNQASDIALIVDACFSSAIVGGQGFKPGPLGDAGLGQLAYDKGIRILAASQADNYAIEDARLSHGLLTFALAAQGEALDLPGAADANEDGRIGLSEWLAYAEMRLPSLSADLEIGRYDARRGQSEDIDPETADEDYIQRPTLFDFNSGPSSVVLRPN